MFFIEKKQRNINKNLFYQADELFLISSLDLCILLIRKLLIYIKSAQIVIK